MKPNRIVLYSLTPRNLLWSEQAKSKGRPVVAPKSNLNANRQPLRYGAEGLQRQDLVDAGEVLVGVHLPARLKDQVLQLGEALLLHKEFGINKGLVLKMKEKH